MKYIRPFAPSTLAPGAVQHLVTAADGVDCVIELRRGGGMTDNGASADERFALVLEGQVALGGHGTTDTARAGDMIFVSAGEDATIEADRNAVWIEIAASLPAGTGTGERRAAVIRVDQSRFEGAGFAYQSIVERASGSGTMRINVLQVEPGAGSPDFHIHSFAQIYVIQEGEMTLDIGRRRAVAPSNSIVILPAGVVHRNYNASTTVERHISLLVPEPQKDEIFDFAVTIHDREAELLTTLPSSLVR